MRKTLTEEILPALREGGRGSSALSFALSCVLLSTTVVLCALLATNVLLERNPWVSFASALLAVALSWLLLNPMRDIFVDTITHRCRVAAVKAVGRIDQGVLEGLPRLVRSTLSQSQMCAIFFGYSLAGLIVLGDPSAVVALPLGAIGVLLPLYSTGRLLDALRSLEKTLI